MTPEGKVKNLVEKFLKTNGLIKLGSAVAAGTTGFYWMPVPYGYGVSYLDFIGHYKGRLFGIETKVPSKNPTPRQQQMIDATEKTGAKAFVVRCSEDLQALRAWFREVDKL